MFVRSLREELFDFFSSGRFKFVEFGRWGRWWRIVGREMRSVAGQDSVTEWSLVILSLKKEPKREGRDGDGDGSDECCLRWRIEFTVVQSWREFPRAEAMRLE